MVAMHIPVSANRRLSFYQCLHTKQNIACPLILWIQILMWMCQYLTPGFVQILDSKILDFSRLLHHFPSPKIRSVTISDKCFTKHRFYCCVRCSILKILHVIVDILGSHCKFGAYLSLERAALWNLKFGLAWLA